VKTDNKTRGGEKRNYLKKKVWDSGRVIDPSRSKRSNQDGSTKMLRDQGNGCRSLAEETVSGKREQGSAKE